MKVGDKAWYEPQSRRVVGGDGRGREITITQVGRKWATADGLRVRFNLITGWLDGKGYTSPGRVWPYKEQCDLHEALVKEWETFKLRVGSSFQPPSGITAETVRIAMEMLKL